MDVCQQGKGRNIFDQSRFDLEPVENQSAVIKKFLPFPYSKNVPLSGQEIPRYARDDSVALGMTVWRSG